MSPQLTVKQAAERAGLSIKSIYELCNQQRLKHTRPSAKGRSIRIHEDALLDYLQSCTVGVQPAGSLSGRPERPWLTHLRLRRHGRGRFASTAGSAPSVGTCG